MLRKLWFLVLCAAALGCPSAATERQKSFASELIPAALEPTGAAAGEVLTGRIRAYADSPYRAQNPHWKRQLRARLRRANTVLEPTAGLRLELVEGLAWERSAPSSDLGAMLEELEDLDTGADVDWVLGLADALPDVTSSIHELGIARPLSSHIVLRGLNDTKEVEVLEAALEKLDSEEREVLYEKRKKHKNTLLLLHEVAHTLGALHINDRTRVLNRSYNQEQKSFHPQNARLIKVAAQSRLAPDRGEEEALSAVLAHLESVDWKGWDSKERKALVDHLEGRVSGAGDGARTPELGSNVRPADREAFRRAAELTSSGKTLEAWEKLEPLLDFYPDEPGVQVLGCRLIMKREVSAEVKQSRCRRAAELAPDDPEPELIVAGALVGEKDRDAALAALAKARARLEEAEGEHSRAWRMLAGYYKELGVVGLAEQAAKLAGGAEEIEVWAAELRARYALPPNAGDFGIEPRSEAAYVEDVKEMLKAIYSRRFDDVERLVRRARKRYGDAPGVHVVLCDLAIRRRRYDQAERECTRALRAFDGASWAHYLTGLLEKRAKRQDRAMSHLERAIELDGRLQHAYKVLAGLYEDAGREDDLSELKENYSRRFGYPLK